MTPAPWIIWKNGISLVVPSAPCTCMARQAMSCSTVGMTTLAVAMSFRTGVRLGHRVAREQLAVEQRLEVALLLLRRAVVGDDLGVAGVGRLRAEDSGGPRRPAQDLAEQRQLELAEALAPEFWAQVRRPQALAANLVLQRVDDLALRVGHRHVLLVREQVIERLDLFPDELVGPVQLPLVLGGGLEMPCHFVSA